jgi:type III secretion system FlhB-like substrate exporter
MGKDLFYTNLENHKEPVTELLSKTELFKRIPEDWFILVTDIKGSTASVKKGLSELVNLIATGSIIAALNIANKHTIDIPFFFGGDGATLLIPPVLLQEIMEALTLHQENIQKEFNINLRVGNISVSDVYKNGQELKIIKARITKLHTIPVILGNGLHFAEKLIKAKDKELGIPNKQKTILDLEGMECKWNKIPPPGNLNEVVSLLINTLSESKQATIFKNILEKTDETYGSLNDRNPISVPKLELKFDYKRIKTELKVSNKKLGILNFLKIWINGLVGKLYYLPSKSGQKYLKELTQLSDILVMDGRINMVISGTSKQRELLTEYLNNLEKEELIIYGMYVSKRSIMSCYVRNRNAKHIHFVDGGSSGYTRAAMVLKEKIRNTEQGI